MYTVSDVVEIGNAQDLILSFLKVEFVQDDTESNTQPQEEYFDE